MPSDPYLSFPTVASPASESPMSIAFATDIGGSRLQQDRAKISSDSLRAVVCDGHGRRGEEFAQAVVDFQMSNTFAKPTELFSATDAHIRSILPPAFSREVGGTSCTHLSFDPEKGVTISNIGDSSARFWDAEGAGVAASVDHCPSDKEEFSRIVGLGGQCTFHDMHNIYAKGKQPVFIKDGDDLVYNTGGGYYYKNCHQQFSSYFETPDTHFGFQSRLAMTRAFGDYVMCPFGLSVEPSVVVLPPTDCVRAIVMASDGLWDVMKNEDIGAIVRNPTFLDSRDATGASAAIMEASLQAARRLFGPSSDNVTVLVAYI